MNEKTEKQIKQTIDQFTKRFSLDSKSAKSYLTSVQSQFILHKPSFKVIFNIIAQENFITPPSPFRTAEIVRQKWEKNISKNKRRKISSDLSKPSLKAAKYDRYDLLGSPSQFLEPEERDYDRPKVVRRTKSDMERVSPNKLPHCPHGVPKGKICAICEPDKFREVTGEG